MSEVKKTKKIKSNKLKEINKEEVDAVQDIAKNSKPKSLGKKEIEKKILKVKFPDIIYQSKFKLPDGRSKNTTTKTYQIIYNDDIKKSTDEGDVIYITTIKDRLETALGIKKIIKEFRNNIAVFDDDNEKL